MAKYKVGDLADLIAISSKVQSPSNVENSPHKSKGNDSSFAGGRNLIQERTSSEKKRKLSASLEPKEETNCDVSIHKKKKKHTVVLNGAAGDAANVSTGLLPNQVKAKLEKSEAKKKRKKNRMKIDAKSTERKETDNMICNNAKVSETAELTPIAATLTKKQKKRARSNSNRREKKRLSKEMENIVPPLNCKKNEEVTLSKKSCKEIVDVSLDKANVLPKLVSKKDNAVDVSAKLLPSQIKAKLEKSEAKKKRKKNKIKIDTNSTERKEIDNMICKNAKVGEITELTHIAATLTIRQKKRAKSNRKKREKKLLLKETEIIVPSIKCKKNEEVILSKEIGNVSLDKANFLPKSISKKDKKLLRIAESKQSSLPTQHPDDEARTIFIGNLDVKTERKELKQRFKKYGEIETIRIRSVGIPEMGVTKKIAVIKQNFHPSRESMNAYIRFLSAESVEKAIQENGNLFKDRHLRVDRAVIDKSNKSNNNSVFVGNLQFEADDEAVYRHFQECGEIVNIRIVRDQGFGGGKGFCFVNFKSVDAVELALQLDGRPFMERNLRVRRCVRKVKVKSEGSRMNSEQQKLKNPASKMNLSFMKNKEKPMQVEQNHPTGDFSGCKTSESGKFKKVSKFKFSSGERKKSAVAHLLAGPEAVIKSRRNAPVSNFAKPIDQPSTGTIYQHPPKMTVGSGGNKHIVFDD